MSKVTAYFSHTIRGRKGVAATPEDMDVNCAKAQEVADWIRASVSDLKLYVPAEHEDFVQLCYLEKLLTEQQILDIDCKILAKMDLHIVLMEDGWLGGGIAVEIDAAKKAQVPIFYITGMDVAELFPLQQKIVEMKKKSVDKMEIDSNYNSDPVRYEDCAWYWWNETWSDRTGPYNSRELAKVACAEYCKHLFEEENNGRETR